MTSSHRRTRPLILPRDFPIQHFRYLSTSRSPRVLPYTLRLSTPARQHSVLSLPSRYPTHPLLSRPNRWPCRIASGSRCHSGPTDASYYGTPSPTPLNSLWGTQGPCRFSTCNHLPAPRHARALGHAPRQGPVRAHLASTAPPARLAPRAFSVRRARRVPPVARLVMRAYLGQADV
jgi:hypothetical protein